MKNIFIVFIFGLILSGCSASWHVQRAKQLDPDIFNTKLETKIVNIKVPLDTTLKFHLKDKLYLDTLIDIRYIEKVVNNKINILPSFDTVIKQNNGLTAKIWMNEGQLYANLELDSIFYYNLKDSIRAEIKQEKEITTIITKKERTFKDWFKITLFVVVFIIAILLIGGFIKFVKWINK